MSIQVTLLTFNKRENSTKKPTAADLSGGAALDCLLIDNTSLMNPTFKFNVNGNPVGYNYCYIPSFERYFFINDWSSSQGFWYASCTCDVLASWKTEIGAGSHYILRSASAYNGDISDEVYPANTNITGYIDYADDGDPLWWYDGSCYIVGIVGYTEQVVCQFGSLIYYVMDHLALKVFLKYIMDNVDTWSSILPGDYSPGVQKALLNPIQYIKSCKYMPFNAEDIQGSAITNIKFGYYDCPIGAGYGVKMVNSSTNVVKTKDISYIDIRQHPQAATRGSYLNCQPYSRYTLHYGPWGDIELDPMLLKTSNKLKLETLYDLVSGVGRLIVSGNLSTQKIIYNGTANIGVDVNLSQVYKDALAYEAATSSGVFNAISAGISLGSGNLSALPEGLNAATSAVQNMTRLNYPTVTGKGDSGCYLPFYDEKNLYLTSKFNLIVDENLAEIGRPLCEVRQLNTLSGYVLCSNADAVIPGTAEEVQKVNGYLNSGFFYE